MTATGTALAALAAALAHASLPAVRRDAFFEEAMAEQNTGQRATALILRRGEASVLNRFMGAGTESFEISHAAELEWFACAATEADTNTIFEAGLEAIAQRIAASPTLGGAVQDCVIEDSPTFAAEEWDSRPCLTALIRVKLVFTSSSPF
jgi:hypothetical protein